MRQRPASRLLIIDHDGRVLLFRFVHTKGPLAGDDYWATPGGGVEDGETFELAAMRELREETGIVRDAIDKPVATRAFVMQLPDGEFVEALEKYYLVRSETATPSNDGWSDQETHVIADQRWWSTEELAQTADIVWPENLLDIMNGVCSP